MVGSVPKQRLTRTCSAISAPARKLSCSYPDSANAGPSGRSIRHSGMLSSSVLSSSLFEAFFLIKNLDTGKEFIVSECGKDGMWNRLSDLQTGKQLTMEEFEKSVGYSPLVKELMHRENFSRISSSSERKGGGGGGINYSYITRSLRMITKRKGVSLIKSGIRGVAHSMSGLICEKEREAPLPALPPPPLPSAEQKLPGKNSNSNSNLSSSSGWIKVRQSGKSYKELSALHLCQEIQAHEGSIWTIKFNPNARYLASAGEDQVVHVWEVQECEVTSLREEGNAHNSNNGNGIGNSHSATPIHPSFGASPDWLDATQEKKKKGKGGSSRRVNHIPDYVHVPETVFALSGKPVCSFKGHLDDVLDLSWSRTQVIKVVYSQVFEVKITIIFFFFLMMVLFIYLIFFFGGVYYMQLLLSSSMDKTVRLWDLESKTCLKMFAHNDYGKIFQMGKFYHKDKLGCACCSSDNAMNL